jgi:hypothetical protein
MFARRHVVVLATMSAQDVRAAQDGRAVDRSHVSQHFEQFSAGTTVLGQ